MKYTLIKTISYSPISPYTPNTFLLFTTTGKHLHRKDSFGLGSFSSASPSSKNGNNGLGSRNYEDVAAEQTHSAVQVQ